MQSVCTPTEKYSNHLHLNTEYKMCRPDDRQHAYAVVVICVRRMFIISPVATGYTTPDEV